MGRKGNKRVYQFIDDLVAVGVRELVKSSSLSHAQATELMTAIAYQFCDLYARSHVYVPAVVERTLTPRDEQIWADYATQGPDGVHHHTASRLEQIAAQRGLTLRHCYNIIALARRRDQAARQLQLAGFEPQDAATVE